MNTIPEPVLGLDSPLKKSAEPWSWRQGAPHAAVFFSVSSVLFMLGILAAVLQFGHQPGNRGGMDFIAFRYAGPLLPSALLFQVAGFLLGLSTKKTRNGRAAMLIAVVPFVIGALTVAVWLLTSHAQTVGG